MRLQPDEQVPARHFKKTTGEAGDPENIDGVCYAKVKLPVYTPLRRACTCNVARGGSNTLCCTQYTCMASVFGPCNSGFSRKAVKNAPRFRWV